MLKKMIIGVIVAGAISAVADAVGKSKKAETNEHDAEKEIYRSLPMSIPISGGTISVSQMKCQNCGGEMQIQNGNKIICCPFCQSKSIIVVDSPSEAYQNVEIEKAHSYERLALEREKLKLEQQKQQRKETNTEILILAVLMIAILVIL